MSALIANWVDAESPQVGEVLRKIVAVVVEGGAQLHPGLRLQERGGFMRVLCEGGRAEADVPLVRMPRELLIPLVGAQWEDRIDRLVLQRQPDGLSAVQQELLGLHIDLYNAAGKLPWFHLHLPDSLLKDKSTLLTAVRKIRPETGDPWQSLADRFIQTRRCHIRYPHPTKGDNEIGAIFPLIDLLNNHHDGSDLIWSDDGVSLLFPRQVSTSQLFLNYGGRRDVLDLALGMGYLDESTPFAHSAPVTLDMVFGDVVVQAMRSRPLHPLDPPIVSFTDLGMIVSHLTVHQGQSKRLRTALDLVVQAALRRNGQEQKDHAILTDRTVTALVNINTSLLRELQESVVPHADQWPSADLLVKATRRQSEIWKHARHA
jgi:hypothetical protein